MRTTPLPTGGFSFRVTHHTLTVDDTQEVLDSDLLSAASTACGECDGVHAGKEGVAGTLRTAVDLFLDSPWHRARERIRSSPAASLHPGSLVCSQDHVESVLAFCAVDPAFRCSASVWAPPVLFSLLMSACPPAPAASFTGYEVTPDLHAFASDRVTKGLLAPHHTSRPWLADALHWLGHFSWCVESGTFHGDTSKFLLEAGCDAVLTIELNPDFLEQFQKKKWGDLYPANITPLIGNSGDLMSSPLLRRPPFKGHPMLFFLDGHYSIDADTKRAEMEEAPVLRELEGILGRANGLDVVVIDDARHFRPTLVLPSGLVYPSLKEIQAVVEGCRGEVDWRLFVHADAIVIFSAEIGRKLAEGMGLAGIPIIDE
ncbi:hypothetical protein TeGR_g11849 [Tetraparma gracilis]|uniref:Uncharacterized protein n=1 Tax=Tetraparma gracilis TaxID=2962635 RepID=A0ABQ6MTS0_9STRA|nr:hypothetical protein TeGR_g11849 [Tetraparma gracilis]